MTEWRVRPSEENDLFGANECPEYLDDDLFTLKLFYGGVFEENNKGYVGGEVRYVDFCNVHKMSILEISSMLTECGHLGWHTFYYKLPKTSWERDLCLLHSDQDVVFMCELVEIAIPKMMHIYVITQAPLNTRPPSPPEVNISQEYFHSQHEYEFVDNDRDEVMDDIDQEPDNLFGDEFDSDESDADYLVTGSESSGDSFFSDASNVDSTDDEVVVQKGEKQQKANAKEVQAAAKGRSKGKGGEKGKGKGSADKGKGDAAKGKGSAGKGKGDAPKEKPAADKDKGCEKPVKTRTKKPVKPVNTTLAVVGEEVQGRPKQQNKATCEERPSKNKVTATTNLGAERPYSNPAMGTTNEGGSVPEGS
ncbi:hypothetical protein ACET3Z_021771 [Daucus carota]